MKRIKLPVLLLMCCNLAFSQNSMNICTNTHTFSSDYLLDSLTVLPDSTMVDWDIYVNGNLIYNGFYNYELGFDQGYFNYINPPLRVFNPPFSISNGDVLTQVIQTSSGTTTGCAVLNLPSDTTSDTTIITTPVNICTNTHTFSSDYLLDSLTVLPDSTMVDWDIYVNGNLIYNGFYNYELGFDQGYFDYTNPPLRIFNPPFSISNGDVLTQVIQTSTGTTSGCAVLNLASTLPNHNCNALYVLYPDATIPHQWFAVNQATGTGPMTYTWYWGDGSNSTGATPSHVYSAAGNYNICLTVSDSTGCTDTYCDSSTYIYKTEQAAITVSCVLQLPTAIEETTGNAYISIYPNPAYNQLCIETNGLAISEINIYNSIGSLVRQIKQPQTNNVDISHLATGVYIAEIKSKDAIVRSRWMKM